MRPLLGGCTFKLSASMRSFLAMSSNVFGSERLCTCRPPARDAKVSRHDPVLGREAQRTRRRVHHEAVVAQQVVVRITPDIAAIRALAPGICGYATRRCAVQSHRPIHSRRRRYTSPQGLVRLPGLLMLLQRVDAARGHGLPGCVEADVLVRTDAGGRSAAYWLVGVPTPGKGT